MKYKVNKKDGSSQEVEATYVSVRGQFMDFQDLVSTPNNRKGGRTNVTVLLLPTEEVTSVEAVRGKDTGLDVEGILEALKPALGELGALVEDMKTILHGAEIPLVREEE